VREQLKNYTLLYAEDEYSVQDKMREYFESYFHAVYCATDGHEALELHRRYRPDVVILDINMPKINGLEVARRIRHEDTYTKIIMLTAHSEKEILLQATEIDMSRYLIKPVSPIELKSALDKVATELLATSDKSDENRLEYTIGKEGLIYRNKTLLELSKSERRALGLLIKNIGYSVAYETFFYDEEHIEISNEATLRNIMAKLRKKCPDLSIKNIKDMGYIIPRDLLYNILLKFKAKYSDYDSINNGKRWV
jgi:DNA-binding response OmpR family regulator